MLNIAMVVGLIKALAPVADPSVIEQAVDDYLEAHPEITVADGSITEEKLASDVLLTLSTLESDVTDVKNQIQGVDNVELPYNNDYKTNKEELVFVNTRYIGTADTGYYIALTVYTNSTKATEVSRTGWVTSFDVSTNENQYVVFGFKRVDSANLVIADMSHYDITRNYILAVSNEKRVGICEDENTAFNNIVDNSAKLLRPFGDRIFYYHQNLENSSANTYIPSQSIYDIRNASALGFNCIELNAQKCSDGVFVCKHGNGGKLGNGIKGTGGADYSETKFEDVTSIWIRENVTYDSQFPKYCGHIPTLDEACKVCKQLSIIPLISSSDDNYQDILAVTRKYLPDNEVIIVCQTAETFNRGNFIGYLNCIWRNENVDDFIGYCKKLKAPLMIQVAANMTETLTDEKASELINKAHTEGFMVGFTYPRPELIHRFLKLGMDFIGSTQHIINPIPCGTTKDHVSTLDDNKLTLSDGATYDSTNRIINMPVGSSIKMVGNGIRAGAVSLILRYSGELTIYSYANSLYDAYQNFASDGTEYIILANDLPQKNGKWYDLFKIEASETTELYELVYDGYSTN